MRAYTRSSYKVKFKLISICIAEVSDVHALFARLISKFRAGRCVESSCEPVNERVIDLVFGQGHGRVLVLLYALRSLHFSGDKNHPPLTRGEVSQNTCAKA